MSLIFPRKACASPSRGSIIMDWSPRDRPRPAPCATSASTMNSSSDIQSQQSSSTSSSSISTSTSTPVLATFYLKNTEHPAGKVMNAMRPEHISGEAQVAIKRPLHPERRQLSLQMMDPCVMFVQFPCRQHCRSLGICIHYQFVAGCRVCPDGLRCMACIQSGVEVVSKRHLHQCC
jgi:hypothetical protein